MTLNASGNLSIGNTNDSYRLDVTGEGRFSSTITAIAPSSAVALQVNGRSSDNIGQILFYANNGTTLYNYIQSRPSFFAINTETNTPIYFGTNMGAGDNIRMTITGSGSVGIGTTSPTQKLTLINGTFQIGGSSTFSDNVEIGRVGGDNNMAFATGGNERMRITSGGVLAVGKSDQSGNAALTIKSPAGGNTGIIMIEGDTTNNGWGMYAVTSDSYVITRFTNGTYADYLTITSAGAATFSSSVTATELYLSTSNGLVGNINSSNANGGYLTWQTSGAVIADIGTAQQIFGSGGNDVFGINGRGARAIAFGTNNTERMRITSGGNVGIGTTSPSVKLTVSNAANGNIAGFTNTVDADLLINLTSGVSLISPSSGILAFGTSSTERMRITSGGNVGIGTTAPVSRLHVSGQITIDSSSPFNLIGNGNSDTYTQTVIYANQNNTSNNTANGIFIERGRLSNSGSAEIRSFVIGDRGGGIQFILNKDGDVGINTSSPSYKLDVNGTARFGAVIIGSLSTGTVYSNAGFLTNTNPSDYRLKNTIKPLTYGLNEVMKLNPKSFYYNGNATNLKYGFIAQEVKEVMPELARKLDENSDYLGLETEGIFVTLVNAIKEQQAQINELKSQIK
jgi:hypothetical protein